MTKRPALEPIKRSELTKVFTAHLGTTLGAAVLIGRGTAPPAGGWPDTNNPGRGAFTPYAVVKTGTALTPAAGERDVLGANATSWNVSYQVTTHHNAESRVDEAADLVRDAVVTFARDVGGVELDGVAWTLQQVTIPRMGPTTPTRATNPPHWQVTDDVSLHLSRVQRR